MKNPRVTHLLAAGLLMSMLTVGCGLQTKPTATPDSYPTKPITIIVPYSAGGGGDLMCRAIEKAGSKKLGQPLVVTNIPGGAATIGWNELAGAKPDGLTIGYVATAALLQPMYNQTRYHYPSALEPLVQVVSAPLVAVASADQPWEQLEGFVAYAKANPGAIKFGHSGLGSGTHVAGELFAQITKTELVQVPFRGEGETIGALLGGHIQLVFLNPPLAKEYYKSGKVKVLGVTGEQRLADPEFQKVPTLKEQGVDMVYSLWHGIAAPKGLPADVKAKLTNGLQDIIQDPKFQQQMNDLGMPVEILGPEEFSNKWRTENTRLEKIVKDTGIAARIAAQKN